MKANYVAVPPAKRLIALADGSSFTYGSSDDRSTQKAARRAVVLPALATSTTLWPGDCIEPELPQDLSPNSLHALEPRSDTPQVHLETTSEPQYVERALELQVFLPSEEVINPGK